MPSPKPSQLKSTYNPTDLHAVLCGGDTWQCLKPGLNSKGPVILRDAYCPSQHSCHRVCPLPPALLAQPLTSCCPKFRLTEGSRRAQGWSCLGDEGRLNYWEARSPQEVGGVGGDSPIPLSSSSCSHNALGQECKRQLRPPITKAAAEGADSVARGSSEPKGIRTSPLRVQPPGAGERGPWG